MNELRRSDTDGPLRIAMNSFYLPSESKIGAGWMSHRLANALVGLGHQVTMYSPCARVSDARYEHVTVPVRGRLRIIKWSWMTRRLDLTRYDAFISQGEDHLRPKSRLPIHVRTLHGSCFDEAVHAERWRDKARMFVLGLTELVSAIRTPHVVGVSAASLRYFPWVHTVIPNGVDGDVFRPGAADERDEDPTILFVGTYERRKRGKLLMEVFRQEIRRAVPKAKLLMVCTDAPDEHGVELFRGVSDEALASLYRRAWVFCLPSSYEGFGVPYAEALMSGLPVVATDNPGAREVLANGGGVIAADEDLGRTLVSLLSDSKQRADLVTAARQAGRRFDAQEVAGRYADLIRNELMALDTNSPTR